MKYRVRIYNEENELISDDIWYGNSIENVKFWVDLAIRDIVQKLNDSKVRLISVNAKATKERIAITEVTLEVDSVESLNKVIRELRKIDSVYEVSKKNKMKE